MRTLRASQLSLTGDGETLHSSKSKSLLFSNQDHYLSLYYTDSAFSHMVEEGPKSSKTDLSLFV